MAKTAGWDPKGTAAIAETTTETMFQEDHFHLLRNEQSDKLVIFFTATGRIPRLFNFWGVGNALVSDYNILFVNGFKNSWYQDGVKGMGEDLAGTIDWIRTWCSEAGVTDILCTGQSMGGYGALLFGGLLKARALAFAGETVLQLPHSRFNHLADKDTELLYPSIAGAFPEGFDATLIIGENDPVDIISAEYLRKMPGAKIIPMKHVGHGPAGYLRNRERLEPVLRAWIEGEELPEFPELGHSMEAAGFSQAFYDGYVHFKNKKYEMAIRRLSRAINLYPTHEEVRRLKACALLQIGKNVEALEQSAVALALYPSSEANYDWGRVLRGVGEYEESRKVFVKMLRQWPNHHRALYALGITLLKMGKRDQAEIRFNQAYALQPKNENYRKRATVDTTSCQTQNQG